MDNPETNSGVLTMSPNEPAQKPLAPQPEQVVQFEVNDARHRRLRQLLPPVGHARGVAH